MPIYVSDDNPSSFEPFDLPAEDVLEGDPEGRVHFLRRDDVVMTGIFVGKPSAFRYVFEMHETIHVLEGEVEVEIDGEARSLRPGSIASFEKGATSIWRIKTPLKEFFVLSA